MSAAYPVQPHDARRADLNRRLRAAFLAGAEERSRADHGRGLTEDELRRILRHYPLAERSSDRWHEIVAG